MLKDSPFALMPPLASDSSFERREINELGGKQISRNSSQAAAPGARFLVRRCVPEAGPQHLMWASTSESRDVRTDSWMALPSPHLCFNRGIFVGSFLLRSDGLVGFFFHDARPFYASTVFLRTHIIELWINRNRLTPCCFIRNMTTDILSAIKKNII